MEDNKESLCSCGPRLANMYGLLTVPVALSTIPLLQMDMEADKTFAESRRKVFQHRKNAVATAMAFLIAASTALGILTGNTIHQKKKQVGNKLMSIFFFDI